MLQLDPTVRDPATVTRIASLYRLSQAVVAAAELGIADAVADGPASAESIATVVGADAPTLARLLRVLAWNGLLAERDGGYGLTELGACLRSGDPSGARAMINGWAGLRETYDAFGRLTDSVRTGVPGFQLANGSGFYDYMATHPERAAFYEAAMASTLDAFEAQIRNYDFSRFRRVVDVGGGNGAFLTVLLRIHPHIEGVLFDLPAVVESARETIPPDVAERIEIVGGDAFEGVPPGGDAYALSTVARCFDEEACVRLLASCRAAMSDDAELLLVEMVMPDEPDPLQALADLQALTVYGGGDRTGAEWRELYARAGFDLAGIEPAMGPYRWVVGRPLPVGAAVD